VNHENRVNSCVAKTTHQPRDNEREVPLAQVAEKAAQFLNAGQLFSHRFGHQQRQHAVTADELHRHANRVVTKHELMKAIWPNIIVTEQVLTHCVAEVRQAIGDGDQAIIKTVTRRGYRFAAPVVRAVRTATAGVSPAVPGRVAAPLASSDWSPLI
jgi:DNA-binding response OmpR family regulator